MDEQNDALTRALLDAAADVLTDESNPQKGWFQLCESDLDKAIQSSPDTQNCLPISQTSSPTPKTAAGEANRKVARKIPNFNGVTSRVSAKDYHALND